jgi:hypothetical protein
MIALYVGIKKSGSHRLNGFNRNAKIYAKFAKDKKTQSFAVKLIRARLL